MSTNQGSIPDAGSTRGTTNPIDDGDSGNNSAFGDLFESPHPDESESGEPWKFDSRIKRAMSRDSDLEESFISIMRHFERHLESKGYQNPAISAEAVVEPEAPEVVELFVTAGIDVSDVDEWLELEDELQEIADRERVSERRIFAAIDRVEDG